MSLPACAVALVLLFDVSNSITDTHMEMQRDATADALESSEIVRIVESIPDGVALRAIAFGRFHEPAVPWHLVRNERDLREFAAQLRTYTRTVDIGRGTETGRAIEFSLRDFAEAPCDPDERIIDVTTDGETNRGGVLFARAAAEAQNVRINAISIENGFQLSEFIRDNVITSNGFVMQADSPESFARAIRRKLVLELAVANN
jgi:Ca-activated chloride channel homolog